MVNINYVNLNLESRILIYHEVDFELIVTSNLGRLVIIAKAIITMNIKGGKHGNNCKEGWVQKEFLYLHFISFSLFHSCL